MLQITLDKYGVLVNEEGEYFYPVTNDDILSAYIYRPTAKTFIRIEKNGLTIEPKLTQFFGQTAFKEEENLGTLFISIGLHNAMSAYEYLGSIHPVVGAVFCFAGLRRQLTTQSAFLNKFHDIYLIAECEEDEEEFKKNFSDFKYIFYKRT